MPAYGTLVLARMARFGSALLLVLAANGCGSREIVLSFDGLVGGAGARCGATYGEVGLTGSELELTDFRLYIHAVRLLTEDGREVPLALTQDDTWQYADVALLDFEDGSSSCTSGTAGQNGSIRGTIDEDARITGLRFRLGVPFDLNHADASTAPAPLSYTSMFWGWNGGYKFVRIDARTTGLPTGFSIHVGSTGCEGDGRGNVTGCLQENRVEVELAGFDPDQHTIAVDVGALLAESNIDVDGGGSAGCQSGVGDPECVPIFHALGLAYDGVAPSGPQRFFSVRAE